MSLRRPKMGAMWALALAGLLGQSFTSLAAERTFQLGSQSVVLEDVSDQAAVYFRSMRLNRVLNVWNVEATVTNLGEAALNGPLVLLVESFTNTTGLLGADGSADGKSFLDLSAQLGNGALAKAEGSVARTLTLGHSGTGAPSVVVKVFARLPQAVAGLQVVRTLDDAGLPLPSVIVDSPGAPGATAQTDDAFGLATLTQTNQTRALRFSAAGYLPVWRVVNASTGAVGIIPNPRLTRRDSNPASFTPIGGGELTRGNPAVQVKFTPGAFSQDTAAVLTPLTPQTLPLFLPQGWSPLAAFWLELSSEPALPGDAKLTPVGPIAPGETAALVKLNTNPPGWEVLQLVNGNGSNAMNVALPGSGAFALVVPDAAPIAPPNPTVRVPLPPSVTPLPDAASLRAGGTVTPSSSPASKVPELVTATAEVLVTNLAGNQPSGTLLRGEVSERYTLRDGTRRFPALFDNFVVGYQRPGDARLDTVRAEFPIRPLLLFGAEELDEAVVHMDLFAPGAFSGGILDTNGGQVASEGLRVLAGLGDLVAQQAVQLKRLSVTNFTELAGSNATVVAAFEIGVNGVAAGRKLIVQLGGLATNSTFVLARVLARSGLYGLEPRERLHSDATGNLVGDEPASGEKLPGLNGAGQYVLLKINPPQGLVSGVARNSTGQPTGGLPVRITGQPWLTFSANDGAFKLLAPAGDATVTVNDLATGDSGAQIVNVPNPQTPVNTQLASVSSGPRVLSVTPTNNATGVSRVTPIVITFSEPVNPGTAIGGNIQLLGTTGTPVTASLTLNLKNTIATLLPTDPLSPSAHFTIQVSTNLTDLTGLKLEGSNQFTFTTETDALNRVGGQVIIYEPTNGLAAVFGSPGTADPESPVILVNDTSGGTATILSKPDGSFTNLIGADVEDFISAVLINRNGTRTTLPASRQIFRDGSVGLFQGGGILEAESDGGPIHVLVEPGAIESRTRFKLQGLNAAQVQSLVENTPPLDAKLIGGGFTIARTGDPVKGSIDVSFPVSLQQLQQLGLQPGDPPEDATYALAVATKVGGDIAYMIVDKMEYENGRLVTHSQPFPGANFLLDHPDEVQAALETANLLSTVAAPLAFFAQEIAMLPLVMAFKSQPVIFTGKVIAVTSTNSGTPNVQILSARPLGGATVTARPISKGLFSSARTGRLDPGTMYCVSKANGHYAFMTPRPHEGNPVDPTDEPERMALTATHPRFFGQRVTEEVSPFVSVASLTDLIFFLSADLVPDPRPSALAVSHTPFQPAPSSTPNATLRILASHGSSLPVITVVADSISPLVAGTNVSLANVTPPMVVQSNTGPFSVRAFAAIGCDVAARVTYKVTASVSSGASPTTTRYVVVFGGSDSNPPGSGPDPTDDQGPRVVESSPQQNAVGLMPGQPIRLRFSEAITIYDASQITLTPAAGIPAIQLSKDQRELDLSYYNIQPNTPYALTIPPDAIRDLAPVPNRLDQVPTTLGPDSFTLAFRSAPTVPSPLPGIQSGGGVVTRGIYAYALERIGSLDGSVRVYDLSDPSAPVKVAELSVPGFPRDLALIPSYSFTRTTSINNAETKDLLAVVGGKVGGSPDQFGNLLGGFQYLWVIDISTPTHPVRLASAVVTLSAVSTVPKVAWSPPYLTYLDFSADVQSIGLVNLQTFILGSTLTAAQIHALGKPEGTPGKDINGDGDYVDTGEELPLPSISRDQFAGKLFSFTIDDTNQRIIDYSWNSGSSMLGVVVGAGKVLDITGQPTSQVAPAAYRTLFAGGLDVNRSNASMVLTNLSPKRVHLLPGAALLSASGQFSVADLALVSAESLAGGPSQLVVIDVTDPTAPLRLSAVEIPAAHGLVQSIVQRDDGLLMLATSQDVLLLDPTKLADPPPTAGVHPALVGVFPTMGSGARSFGGNVAGINVVNLGGKNQFRQTSPRVSFVSFTDTNAPPFSPSNIVDQLAVIQEKFKTLEFVRALLPARFRTITNEIESTLSPPKPETHYYVMVDAPGSAGPTIEVTLESLNEAGYPLRNKGLGFPPVHALASSTLTALQQQPQADCGARIRSLTAYRLSSRKGDPLYNVYLSKPFAVTYESFTQADLNLLQGQLDREIIWSGRFQRAGLDPDMANDQANNMVFGPFLPGFSSAEKILLPAASSAIADTLPADYIMGPNPPHPSGYDEAPATFGTVSSHNGEFRLQTVDFRLPSRRMPIEFERTVAAQDLYEGPFGRGWDFNYNERLVELRGVFSPPGSKVPLILRGGNGDEIAKHSDILLFPGNGRTLLYQFAGSNAPPEFASDPLAGDLGWLTSAHAFFRPPSGVFDMLVRFDDGRFARLTPDGQRTWYTPDGRLDKIQDRYTNNVIALQYNDRGELARIVDNSVSVPRYLEIGYYRPNSGGAFSSADETTSVPAKIGKIRRLLDYSGRDVLFDYNDCGELTERQGVAVNNPYPLAFNGRSMTKYIGPQNPTAHPMANGPRGVIAGGTTGSSLFTGDVPGGNAAPVIQSGTGAATVGPVGVDVQYPNTAAAVAAGSGKTVITTPDGSKTETIFDTNGLPRTVTMSGAGAPNAVFQYEHDTNGLITKITYPEQNSLTFTYDSTNANMRSRANLLTVKRDPGPRGNGASAPIPTVTLEPYDPKYNFPVGKQTDPNAHTITHTPTPVGLDIGTVDYPGAGITKVEYNEYGQPTRRTSIEGFTTDYHYDAAKGFLIEEIRGVNLKTTYEYNGLDGDRGMVTRMIPPEPKMAAVEMDYDERGQLITLSRDGKFREERSMDVNGYMVRRLRQLDSNQQAIETQDYLQNGFLKKRTLLQVEKSLGAFEDLPIEYVPDPLYRIKEIHFPGGEVQKFENYDHLGRYHQMSLGTDYAEEYTYDLSGNLLTVKRDTATDSYEYDGHDRQKLAKLEDKNNFEQLQQTFHGSGQVRKATVLDSNSQVNREVENEIDSYQRLTKATVTADGGPAIWQTIHQGLVTRMINPANEETRLTHNTAGQVLLEEDSVHTVAYAHDKDDNLLSTTSTENGLDYKHTFSLYNPLDQPLLYEDNLGVLAEFTPRYDGLIKSVKDARTHSTDIELSKLGERLKVTRPNGIEFDYGYNKHRDSASIKDKSNQGRSLEYDQFRLKKVTFRDGTTSEVGASSFDKRNRQPLQTTIPGGLVSFERDPKGRIRHRTLQYTSGTREEDFTYDGLDRPVTVSYPFGSVTYDYFKLGPLRKVTEAIRLLTYETSYAVRNDSARLTVTYPSPESEVVTEGRDLAGRLGTVTTSMGEPVVSSANYANAELAGTLVFGSNVLQCVNLYDGRKRLIGRTYTSLGSRQVLAEVRYAYDTTDNIVARQFLHRSARADFFEYDEGHRLTRADFGVHPSITLAAARGAYGTLPVPASVSGSWAAGYFGRTYQYDPNPLDLLARNIENNPDNLPMPHFARSFSGPDGLLFVQNIDSFVRVRDSLGNAGRQQLLVRPAPTAQPSLLAATLTYDGDSHPIQIVRADNVILRYDYDHRGLWFYRTMLDPALSGGISETAFIYDGGLLIAEYDRSLGANTLKARYYYHNGDAPVAGDLRDASGNLQRYYAMLDALGSTIGLVDTNGVIVERYFYDAWGQPEIELPDKISPRIKRIRTAVDGLYVEFSERVLPPVLAAPPGGLVNQLQPVSGAFTITNNNQAIGGAILYEESVQGAEFGTVLHFQAGSPLTGVCTLTLMAGQLVDEWNNPNLARTVSFTFNPTVDTPLFTDDNISPTGPTHLARSSVGWPFLFHGQYFDYDAGLSYMRSRFYDPSTGLFLQQDPAGYEDSVNLYAAFANNPVTHRDPTGMATRLPRVRTTIHAGGGAKALPHAGAPHGGPHAPPHTPPHGPPGGPPGGPHPAFGRGSAAREAQIRRILHNSSEEHVQSVIQTEVQNPELTFVNAGAGWDVFRVRGGERALRLARTDNARILSNGTHVPSTAVEVANDPEMFAGVVRGHIGYDASGFVGFRGASRSGRVRLGGREARLGRPVIEMEYVMGASEVPEGLPLNSPVGRQYEAARSTVRRFDRTYANGGDYQALQTSFNPANPAVSRAVPRVVPVDPPSLSEAQFLRGMNFLLSRGRIGTSEYDAALGSLVLVLRLP